MSWNKGGNRGPWGSRPSGGGNNGGSGSEPPPDIDELIRKSQESFKHMFGDGGGSTKPLILMLVAIVVLWFGSGIYRVDADEQGVVLRFGEFHRITEPGLNYHLPYPIETALTPRVTTINREEIGFRSIGNMLNKENRKPKPEESLMLTGDKNLVSTQFEVQWRIKDAVKFLFNVRRPDLVVKPVAETAMREVIGNEELDNIISGERGAIGGETQKLMQSILDDYNTGIEIYEVNLLAVDAPEPVVDAFIDVLSAQQEKETLQNQAQKYRDGIIPVAQGQVEKMVKDAQAYKEAVVAEATGDAARFVSVYNEYKQAKDVTKKRMYLETMEKIMSGMNKVILDDHSGQGVLPYLPLPEVKKRETTNEGGQ